MRKQENKMGQNKKKTLPVKNARPNNKKTEMIQLLRRPDGVTLEGLMKASGWQAHSVRGFLSGTVAKKMGLRVNSSKSSDGKRIYSVA